MMKRILSLSLLAAFALDSCTQRDICFNHDDHALTYTLNANFSYTLIWHENYDYYNDIMAADLEDWLEWLTEMPASLEERSKSVVPSEPEGVRVLATKDGKTFSISNLAKYSGSVRLSEGNYSLLFYNNDTEAIVFSDDDHTAGSMTASTRTRVRSTYLGNSYVSTKSENTVTEPDILFCHYEKSFTAEKTIDGQTLDVEMKPVVYTYLVSFSVSSGMQYIALARGALAGMAASVHMDDGTTSSDEATVLFDCDLADNAIVASVNSFGIPDYTPDSRVFLSKSGLRRSDNHTYGLTLEVKLKNGNLKTFDFNVTDQVSLQPNGGVITVGGITISDEDGKQGGSAFDVDVEGWGDYEDVVLPLI